MRSAPPSDGSDLAATLGKGAAKAVCLAVVVAFAFACLILLVSVWDIGLPYLEGDVNPYSPGQPGTQSTGERIFYLSYLAWGTAGLLYCLRVGWLFGRRIVRGEQIEHPIRNLVAASAIVMLVFWVVIVWNANGW